MTPADSNVGAPGAPGGGTADGGGTFVGDSGSSGYGAYAFNGPSFVVDGPTLTGGAGGEVTGTDPNASYEGGFGGSGLAVGGGATATVNSGTFTGAAGGAAGGVGKSLIGGYGGDGLNVNSATASVYGGTFQGGASGTAAGAGTLGSQAAGNGLNANLGSTVNVYGGSFTGGNAAPGGFLGDGLLDIGGKVNVYGGSFNAGSNGFGLDVFEGTTILHGTNFFVNGVPLSSGRVTGSGTITGDFADNAGASTLTYQVLQGTNLYVNSAPVPEASSVISLGLLLALGVGGLAVARRKRAA